MISFQGIRIIGQSPARFTAFSGPSGALPGEACGIIRPPGTGRHSMSSTRQARLAVDIGGTFTDVVLDTSAAAIRPSC
jgi:hypothetical protein